MESAFSSTRSRIVRRLRAAASETEVVRVVRDFLAEWRPEELARVPRVCRPGKIRDGEDIADCAFALTKARMQDPEAGPLMIEMESFFAQACTRISEIEGTPSGLGGRADSESESA